jgi:hypothetical protein
MLAKNLSKTKNQKMKIILLFLSMVVTWLLLVMAIQALANINARRYMKGKKFIDLFKNQNENTNQKN